MLVLAFKGDQNLDGVIDGDYSVWFQQSQHSEH